jgi:hypothetical protein
VEAFPCGAYTFSDVDPIVVADSSTSEKWQSGSWPQLVGTTRKERTGSFALPHQLLKRGCWPPLPRISYSQANGIQTNSDVTLVEL